MVQAANPASATEQSPAEAGSAGWLIVLTLVTLLALSAATLLLPHDRYIRYQQLLPTIQFRTVWSYERIEFDPTPIEIAVIGNSRLQASVSGPQLEADLARSLGRPVRVANLSLPQEGRNAHFAVAKLLLERRPELKLIVLSAIEQMPREGHPAFRNIAEASDIVAAPMLLNRDYLNDLAFVPYRQMALFVQSHYPASFGVSRGWNRGTYIGTQYDSTLSFDTPTGNHVDRDLIHSEAELLPSATARARSITPQLLPQSAADVEFAVERHYTRDIQALAAKRGVKVAFLYAPIFHYPLPVGQADFYRSLGPLAEAKFLSSHPDYYSDYGHVNRRGAQKITSWLAEFIVAQRLLGQPQLPAKAQ